jgi:hypothetical protein
MVLRFKWVITMSILESVLQEELQRLDREEAALLQRLSSLPKGSLVAEKIASGTYWYRRFREGDKVRSVYLGKDGTDAVKKAQAASKQYHQLQQGLRQIRLDQVKLRKALRHYGGDSTSKGRRDS